VSEADTHLKPFQMTDDGQSRLVLPRTGQATYIGLRFVGAKKSIAESQKIDYGMKIRDNTKILRWHPMSCQR
jgi:hypothetical protein